jgi:hypothetical protein
MGRRWIWQPSNLQWGVIVLVFVLTVYLWLNGARALQSSTAIPDLFRTDPFFETLSTNLQVRGEQLIRNAKIVVIAGVLVVWFLERIRK